MKIFNRILCFTLSVMFISVFSFQTGYAAKTNACITEGNSFGVKHSAFANRTKILEKRAYGLSKTRKLLSEIKSLEGELKKLQMDMVAKGKKFHFRSPTCKNEIKKANDISSKIFGAHETLNTIVVSEKKTGKEKVYILVLDGGGVRGIIGARIIQAIEEKMNKPITELFDYFAGTSTGGLLALLLNMKDEKGKQRYSGKEAVSLYNDLSGVVFAKDRIRSIKTLGGLIRSKFSAKPLENLLKESRFFGSVPLKNSMKPLFIVAWDMENRKNYVFDSTASSSLMWEAGRATSAAPTYFKAFNYRGRTLVDGGLTDNSPGLVALRKLRKEHPNAEFIMVSLGTGHFPVKRKIKTTGPFAGGIAQKVGFVVEDLMSAAALNAHKNLKALLGKNYVRITPTLSQKVDLADADPAKLNQLLRAAEGMVSSPEFNKAIQILKEKN